MRAAFSDDIDRRSQRRERLASALLVSVRFLWHVIRLPILAVLLVLEPLVRVVFFTLAFLGTLVAFILKFGSTLPHFPFWGMLGVSLGCLGVAVVYGAIVRLLSLS